MYLQCMVNLWCVYIRYNNWLYHWVIEMSMPCGIKQFVISNDIKRYAVRLVSSDGAGTVSSWCFMFIISQGSTNYRDGSFLVHRLIVVTKVCRK